MSSLKTIGRMQPGDVGYTYPWAYNANTKYLHLFYEIAPEPEGTRQLRVECRAHDDGFDVKPAEGGRELVEDIWSMI